MTVFCEAGIQEQTARSQHFLVRGKCDVDITVLLYESVRIAVFTNKPKMCLWFQRISTGCGHCNSSLNPINNKLLCSTEFNSLLDKILLTERIIDNNN